MTKWDILYIIKSILIIYINNFSKTYKCTEDTTSRDSDSLIHEYVEATQSMYCWNHPKVRENWKTVCAAVTLLIVGIGLLGMGAFAVAEPENGLQGAVFFVAGMICFVPGAYHVVYIWLAARGQRGYDFYHLPLFTWFYLYLNLMFKSRCEQMGSWKAIATASGFACGGKFLLANNINLNYWHINYWIHP